MSVVSHLPDRESPPESERALSARRPCAGCGTSLDDKRRHASSCSARCRTTQARRDGQQQRVVGFLDTLTKTATELRQELFPKQSHHLAERHDG